MLVKFTYISSLLVRVTLILGLLPRSPPTKSNIQDPVPQIR